MLSMISLGTLNSDLMSDLRAHDFVQYLATPLLYASECSAVRNIRVQPAQPLVHGSRANPRCRRQEQARSAHKSAAKRALLERL
jgi:hypothetical protein